MRLSNKRYMLICTALCILLMIQVDVEAEPNNKAFSVVSMTLHDEALAGAHDVELSNNIAFVPGKEQSLSIIDITNPQKPEILWYKYDPEIPDSETVLPVGKHLLLGTRDFLSLDITNPDNPVILKKISDRPRIDHINGMVKHGDYVFAASKSGWVNAFDVKDLNNPELFGVLETRKQFNITHPHDIDIFNDYIVVVDPVRFGPPVGKVALFKVMEKGTVLPVEQWKLEGVVEGEELIGANRVQIKGSVAYIGGAYSTEGREEAGVDSGHMGVVDISNPKKPEIICDVPFSDIRGPVGLTIAGNIVFCAGGQSIDAFDISDPLKPIKLASQSFEIYKKADRPGNYHDLIYRDGYLYISAQADNGFLILKVDDSRIRKLADSVPNKLSISGVFPDLTGYTLREDVPFTRGNECGIGAIVPWAGKLYMINYGAHYPEGSSHSLYVVDDNLNMEIHPLSVGGTPAGRMVHRESNQLLIGPYLIDSKGDVRVISPKVMPARITAIARHLVDPANMVYYIDMDGRLYEANVNTLAVKLLFRDAVPGVHGKGGYTSQGRLVTSNNGQSTKKRELVNEWQVDSVMQSGENAGTLAEWDGDKWRIIEQRQYTDVTGPGGIYGAPNDKSPLWAIGWDRRSLRLKLLDGGNWYTYLLPKAAHNNDARHGWFTEWPRIRQITDGRWMMDMHGMFFDFPKTFSKNNSAGISPISSHLRYIPDFCQWKDKLVIASDETSIQGNPMAGQPQCNLWFGDYDDLKKWGPASGFGGPWINDKVKADTISEPFLMKGFKRRVVHLTVSGADQVKFTFEIDEQGNDNWKLYKSLTVADGQYRYHIFDEDFNPCWLRIKVDKDCTATAYFHLTDDDYHDPKQSQELFAGLADIDKTEKVSASLLYPAKRNRNLRVIANDPQSDRQEFYEFTKQAFDFKTDSPDEKLQELIAVDHEFSVDQASVIVKPGTKGIPEQYLLGEQLRLPKGSALFDTPLCGPMRFEREVESERSLANVHGTFYEVPLYKVRNPSLWSQVRPVSSHNKQIYDFATWNGLLVLSGVDLGAREDGHLFKSDDGQTGLWFGGIDDIWKFGKPVGVGGPWKDSSVIAGQASDPYLMTGYDKKTLELTADKDVTVTVEVDCDHQTGWHIYKSFKIKAGQTETHIFPQGYSAHWVRVTADLDCKATAWFKYE